MTLHCWCFRSNFKSFSSLRARTHNSSSLEHHVPKKRWRQARLCALCNHFDRRLSHEATGALAGEFATFWVINSRPSSCVTVAASAVTRCPVLASIFSSLLRLRDVDDQLATSIPCQKLFQIEWKFWIKTSQQHGIWINELNNFHNYTS